MPSLAQLTSNHPTVLVLDAASTRVQVGLLRAGEPALWRETVQEAGTGIFGCVEGVLAEAQLKIGDVDAFVFCEGPGSMLGTRTIGMALRTWQVLRARPAFAYQSLTIASHFAAHQRPGRAFAVIADARRETWHYQSVSSEGMIGTLQRLAASELPPGEWLTPENFRSWAQPARPVAVCSYDLQKIFPTLADEDFFNDAPHPDAFQHQAPEYKKWSAQIHRAAVVEPK